MHTKFFPCPCFRPRLRRQPSKFSTAPSGHKTKRSNLVWLRNQPVFDARKLKLWNTSYMAAKITQRKYGLWLAKFSPSLFRDTLEIIFPELTSHHWKLSSTNHTRQSFSMSLTVLPERSSFFSFRKSRETSSFGMPSLLSQDVEKNFCPESGHTCCR